MRPNRLRTVMLISGLSATAAIATQPSDSVTSDAGNNTAVGSNALLNLPALGAQGSCNSTGGGPYVPGLGFGFTFCSWRNTAVGGGALKANGTGHNNTAVGSYAMQSNTSGYYNTGIGNSALAANTSGWANTGVGTGALLRNTNGYYNTAVGTYSLLNNLSGVRNSAFGSYAMLHNQSGSNNSASGSYAIHGNTTGSNNSALGTYALESNNGDGNTAVGAYALQANTSGTYNAAVGYKALAANISGGNNTAFGRMALSANTVGAGNAAQGFNALLLNANGARNTAIGNDALQNNVAGSYNSAIGFQAGLNITGSYNIDIANNGVAGESNTTRIGTDAVPGVLPVTGVTATYIAGIYNTNITGGKAVYVTAAGQLVTEGSSERFKTDVATMPDVSARLAQLHPVTFRYKTDQAGTLQYGLIAEEVEKVSPELVLRDDAGRIQGVRYEELAPMLLSEMQHAEGTIAALVAENRAQAEKIRELDAEVAELKILKRELGEALQRLPAPGH